MNSITRRGYSRYVSLMKFLLPIGILLSVGLTFLWPYLHSSSQEKMMIVDTSQPEIRENRMIRPRYMSTDEKGQPFQVDADWGKQQTEEVVDLVTPKGSMNMIEGQTFNLAAQKGKYNSEAKILELEGDVTLISTDGYRVKTEKAQISIDNKIIEGNSPVEGEGPTGAIMGERFKVENRPQGKKVISLYGRSRVVINKSSSKKDKEPHV